MNLNQRLAMYSQKGSNGFRNYGGAAGAGMVAQELDPNDRTITLTVANANPGADTVTIFGANRDLNDAAVPAGVTITVAESSHVELKRELIANPFRIYGMKYVVGSSAQFSNTLNLVEATPTGGEIRRTWQPLNYRSAQNNLTDQIDAPNFELLVNAKTYIEFTINANETVTFTFSLSQKLESKNTLRGQSPNKVATVGAPTGLPQLDIPMAGRTL